MSRKYIKFYFLILIGCVFVTPALIKALGYKIAEMMVGEETRSAL